MSDRLTERAELIAQIREAVVDWSPTNPRLDTVDLLRQAADALEDCATLREAIATVVRYRQHATGCEINQTDFCSCGLREAMDSLNDAARAPSQPDETPKK